MVCVSRSRRREIVIFALCFDLTAEFVLAPHERPRVWHRYELFTGAARPLLDRWFESDILKTTLATDAVIGAMIGRRGPY